MEMNMPVTPYAIGGNGGMFGNQNEWIVFLIIAMMFGWGNGFGGRGFGGVTGGEVFADQFALQDLKNGQRQIDSGIRGIERGICDSSYAMAQQGSQTREAITNGVYGMTNAITDVGSKLSEC